MVIGGWFWTLGKELLQAEILLDASDTPRKKKGFKINRVFPVSMAFRSTSKEKGDYSVPASGSSKSSSSRYSGRNGASSHQR